MLHVQPGPPADGLWGAWVQQQAQQQALKSIPLTHLQLLCLRGSM